MRVVPHQHFSHKPPKRRLHHKVIRVLSDRLFYTSCIVLVLGFGLTVTGVKYWHIREKQLKQQSAPSEELQGADQPYGILPADQLRKPREFSSEAFRQLYERTVLPNTKNIEEEVQITGNLAADSVIRTAATSRGYVRQSVPERPLLEIDGFLLQEKAVQPWQELKTAAATAGVGIELLSAFRSPNDQRTLFTSYLAELGVNPIDIAGGRANKELDTILSRVALPGYSRHHTGYTVDLKCTSDQDVTFAQSHCNTWLSANNYEQPKLYGWIPSYPPGAGLQGPEPEPWEYVWVGAEALY